MKKEKVGILTFHQALNYGAVLQAYALKEVCNQLGYDTYIVNYEIEASDKPNPLKEFIQSSNKKNGALKFIRNIMSYHGDVKRWKNFIGFRSDFLNESSACKNGEDISKLGYDHYISGSDQIWNYKITGDRFDPVFFLDFNTNSNKIIYAASSQDTPFPLNKEIEFKNMLNRIDSAVSIREQKLSDYVSKLTGVQYPAVVDPTLLAGRQIIEKIVDKKTIEKPYILIYQIDSNPESDISVKNLKKRFGCDVYTMTVPRWGSIRNRKGTAGPGEFLSLLKNAKFVVTNSFHGIALSLLFEKNFFVYENGGVMSRIDSLLKNVGLCNRKVKMVADIDTGKKIDYESVDLKLSLLREQSLDFLKNAFIGERTLLPVHESVKSVLPMDRRKKKDCCGCSACADICPVNAIEMKTDDEGFLYPYIHKDLCVNCGKCDKACGFVEVSEREEPYSLPKAYGIKHVRDSERESSRSGAAFIAFSDIILNRGGVVYGAVMKDDFSVSHMRATSKEERDLMKKAKYVQSDIRGVYPQVEGDLKKGKYVLFSGTPCQVAGLQAYLKEKGIDNEKLYCCDLVCHGVPSPSIWKDYLNHIREKYNSEIIDANFRDKEFGWDSHCESFVLENRNKKVVSRDYTDLFYQHIMFRPCCHECPFANVIRPGDLSLADFWGIEKNKADFDDNHGVSLVLVNTEKGAQLFENAKTDFNWFECNIENCIQPTLVKPSSVSSRRDSFWADYKIMDFDSFLKKYTTPLTRILRVKKMIKVVMYHLGIRKHL